MTLQMINIGTGDGLVPSGNKPLLEAMLTKFYDPYGASRLRWVNLVQLLLMSTHYVLYCFEYPDSKVHGANMGPIWGRRDPGGPHVGPMNFALWVNMRICLHFLSLMNTEVAEPIEILPHADLDLFMLYSCHGWWWPDDLCRQGIISHGIGLVLLQYCKLTTRRQGPTLTMYR